MRFNIQLTLLFIILGLIYSQGFIDDIVSKASEVGRDINSFFDDIVHPTPTRRQSSTSSIKQTKTSSDKTSSSIKPSRSSARSSTRSSSEEELSTESSSTETQVTRTLSRQIVNNATSHSTINRSSTSFVLIVCLSLIWVIHSW